MHLSLRLLPLQVIAMAPFFGSSLYTRPRRRRSVEPKITTSSNASDSSLPPTLHAQSLPNLEQLRGLSASFLEELTPLLQSRPVVPASPPALLPSGIIKLQSSALTTRRSTQALRIVKRSVLCDIADLLPGKGAVRKVKAIRKLIRELNHGIDELYDSFHQMQYPTSLVHHHSEFRCLYHGYPIKVLDDHLDAMREDHYPLEMRIKALRRDNDVLKSENCSLNNQLLFIKNGSDTIFHEQDRRICQLNHFITALLDVKSNIKVKTLEEGEEKPTIDVTVVEAIQGAAKDENSLWASIFPAVIDQRSKRLFIEEFIRNPKLYDELRQLKAKYRLWKVLAQRNPEHATYITPSPSKTSLAPGGNALQPIKDSEPGAVDETVNRLHDGGFSVKPPPYFVIESSILDKCTSASAYPSAAALLAQADAILPLLVDPLDATAQTPLPSISDLVRALPSVSACSIFSSDTESEEESGSPSSSDGNGHFADSNQSTDLDYMDKHPEGVPRDAALLVNNESPVEFVQTDSDEQIKWPVPAKPEEYGLESPSLPDIVADEAEIFDISQEGLGQYVDKYPPDGRRNPVLRDVHENSSQDAPTSPQQFEHQEIIDVDDQSDPDVRDVGPVAVPWEERRVPKPSPENVRNSEQPRESSLLSSIASSSGNSLKRLSSAGSSIKKSISNGLKRLRQISSNSTKSPNDTTKQGSFRPVALHQRQISSTQGKENLVPKAKAGKTGSKAASLPPQQASAPSRSRRPTISSTLKAVNNTQLTNVTPDRPFKAKHQKALLATNSSATVTSPPLRRLPLTTIPTPQNAEQTSKPLITLKRRRRAVHAFGNLFS